MKRFDKKYILVIPFLVVAILFIISPLILKVDKKENTNIINMDIDYIKDNFEVLLYDEKDIDGIKLEVEASYLGKDKIVEQPKINMNVSCYYMYEEVEEEYTDLKSNDIEVNYVDGKYVGESKIDLVNDNLKSYSCSYQIVNTTGKYIKR